MAASGAPPVTSDIITNTIHEIELLFSAVWNLIALEINPLRKADDTKVAVDLYISAIPGLARDILQNISLLISGNLTGTGEVLFQVVTTELEKIGPALVKGWHDLIQNYLTAFADDVLAKKITSPDDINSAFASALDRASLLGVGSRLITMIFELFLPKKMNTFNWLGPQLSELAGYNEIIGAWRESLFDAALKIPAQYHWEGQFKPRYPDETDAVLWHSRGLLNDKELDEIFQFSGLKQKYEPAFLTSAYHSISPFVMIRLLETGVFDEATARDELTFAGIRPKSQDRMIAGAAYLVADPYRKQVVASLEAEYANGLIDDTDFTNATVATRHTNDIDALTLQRAQLQRHIKLSGELEAAYLALGLSGLIDEPTYASLLAGLPMTQDAINARLAILDARLKATTQKQLLAQERALERQTLAVERRTAMRNYASGIIDEAALAVALIATGLTAIQVAAWVDLAVLQKKGTIRFVYGLEKTPADAQLLRERVASLLDQRKKMLIDDVGFVAQLQALGIPADVQNALLAGAAALTTPASARELVTVRTG